MFAAVSSSVKRASTQQGGKPKRALLPKVKTQERTADAPVALALPSGVFIDGALALAAQRLHERGVVSLQVGWDGTALERDFVRMHCEYRTFAPAPATEHNQQLDYAPGGFAAEGSPDADHHPTVRRWREHYMCVAVPVLGAYMRLVGLDSTASAHSWRVAQFPDRVMERLPGKKPMAESWHTDECPFIDTTQGARVLGGWINTSARVQFFSLLAGSHRNPPQGNGGFGQVTLEQVRAYATAHPDAPSLVRVEPGGVLLFFENVIHEVVCKVSTEPVRRLFTSMYLTRSDSDGDTKALIDDPLDEATCARLLKQADFREPTWGARDTLDHYAHITQMMRRQQSIPLKSGQSRALYPKMWRIAHRERLQHWSDTCVRQSLDALFELDTTSTPHRRVAKRYWPSLTELGVPYENYSHEHLAMYVPSTRWCDLASPWPALGSQLHVSLTRE